MTPGILRLFVEKDLQDLRSSPQVWPGYLILPLVAIGLPVVFLLTLPVGDTLPPRLEELRWLLDLARRDPELARYPAGERLGRLVVRDFGALYLLLPVLLSGLSSALAFVLEKQQRTLEPLLATPVRDRDLVLAKLVAATLPAVVLTVVTGVIGTAILAIVSTMRYGAPFLPSPALAVLLILLAPLVGSAAALLGMRVSVRSQDVPSAIQTSGLLVVPSGLLLAGLVGRPAAASAVVGLVAALLLALLNWWLFRGNVRRFEREALLTRWR